ncbi:MAG: mercury transporter [Gemmatimonadetes bacterium]|nr:mercury transporter [Gemmatimonadota bacterium]
MTGGVAAAFGSLLCCTGPLVLASAGMSGAALSGFLPYRPFFVVAAVGLLWLAFNLVEREEAAACEPDAACASSATRKKVRNLLWISAVISFVFLSSPLWARFVFEG